MSDKNYFQQLTAKEKTSKLIQFEGTRDVIRVWVKGQSVKETFEISDLDQNPLSLNLFSKKSNIVGKSVLYTFALNGLSFFGKGRMDGKDGVAHKLICNDELFKAERRASFRLLTHADHKVFAEVYIGAKAVAENKVFNLRSGLSETGLFKSFLSLVGNSGESDREGYVPIQVLDISTGGFSAQLGEFEASHFKVKQMVKNVVIKFDGDEVEIPEVEIVYMVDALLPQTTIKIRKIGFKFIKTPNHVDVFLGRKINDLLREQESEFEDFIG